MTPDGQWLHDVARREWVEGFGSGLLLGVMLTALVVACVVAYAMSEVPGE